MNNQNYLEIILEDRIYIQRTQNSKFVEFTLDGERICSYDKLPSEVQNVINLLSAIEKDPKYFFNYEKTKDGIKINKIKDTLAITRHIKIPDFIDGMPVVELGENIIERNLKLRLRQIQLPNSISKIGRKTFEGCQRLEYVNIPNELTTLPEYCFESCWNLLNIDLNNVTNCEVAAFYDCRKLKEIDFSKIINIDERIFAGCIALEKVKLSDNLTYIATDMFHNCRKLKEINLSDNITTILDSAFFNCKELEEIKFPKNLKAIYAYAFQKSGITTFTAPEKLDSIGAYAFYESDIKILNLNKKLSMIGPSAFADCNIEQINMYSDTLYADTAFDYKEKLKINFYKDTDSRAGYLRI